MPSGSPSAPVLHLVVQTHFGKGIFSCNSSASTFALSPSIVLAPKRILVRALLSCNVSAPASAILFQPKLIFLVGLPAIAGAFKKKKNNILTEVDLFTKE